MKIFALLGVVSTAALALLYQLIIIPSEETIRLYNNNQNDYLTIPVQGLNQIENFSQQYRRSQNISKDEVIPSILAIDAISVEPVVKLFSNGTICGLINNSVLSKQEVEELSKETMKQEVFLNSIKNQTLSSAFVYQLQPLNPCYPCSVIFIEGANNGKATGKQLKNIESIKNILQKQGFKIIAFASDGDSTYSPLVNQTLTKHVMFNKPLIQSDETLYTNDPLHLLKRARYRFLSHNFTLFDKNGSIFNYSKIIDIFNLPKIVFNNARITKMQDSLPLRLFTLHNLNLLLELELSDYAAYFLPFCLFNTALSHENLLVDDRVDLLEISFFYLEIYKDLMSHRKQTRAPQRGKSNVLLFDSALIDDFLATILTINSLLNTYVGPLCLNRVGTNPLEHHFGLLRLKSKYRHDWENILRNEKKITLFDHLKKEIIEERIRSRRESYGPLLYVDNRLKGNPTNLLVAQSLLQKFGITLRRPISRIQEDTGYAIISSKITQFLQNEQNHQKSTVFSSKQIKLTPSTGAYIQKRQDALSSLNFEISNDEIDSSSSSETPSISKTRRKRKSKHFQSESQPV